MLTNDSRTSKTPSSSPSLETSSTSAASTGRSSIASARRLKTGPLSTVRRSSSSTLIARSRTRMRTTRRYWRGYMTIRVRQPGLLTTVQDTGRFGKYDIGMPPSGAVELFSYQVGNYLVGNEEGAAGLEITYWGPELEFTEDAVIAITGAEMPPKINDEEAATWEALKVESGDVLSFDYLKSGARSYLAVAGGIAVPEFLGSRSTYTLIGLGGHEGRVGVALDEGQIPTYSKETELRVIIGLASYRISEKGMEEFLNTEWTVTPDADRVGYRFKGGEIEFVEREQPAGAGAEQANVVDFGYPVGSIQVPGGVEPIVLLNDAVTGGGYATIGTVVSADRDRLAQTKTNDKTRFRSVDLEEALKARKQRQQQMEEIRQSLSN